MTTSDVTKPLILDFLEWVAAEPRAHREVMEAWRTSCPRLTVWEDSVDAGYVERVNDGRQQVIRVTPRGLQFLKSSGRRQAARERARSVKIADLQKKQSAISQPLDREG